MNANIREGPGTNYRIIGEVKKGVQLELIEPQVEWVKVKLPDGNIGWVFRKLVRDIKKIIKIDL